ncbi:MAG: hypothetical protein MJ066_02120 [Clostridia bacterium]|nr:hypothetical protein [Clostridia bacterium]
MENKGKAETFIGFSIRANKCKIGVNAVATLKRANLIIVGFDATENTVKEAEKLQKKFGCPMIFTKEKTLEQMTFKSNAKVMAITDGSLAQAIIDNSQKDF